MTNTCINCKSKLEGPYCYQRGEKIVTEKDFSITVNSGHVDPPFRDVDPPA